MEYVERVRRTDAACVCLAPQDMSKNKGVLLGCVRSRLDSVFITYCLDDFEHLFITYLLLLTYLQTQRQPSHACPCTPPHAPHSTHHPSDQNTLSDNFPVPTERGDRARPRPSPPLPSSIRWRLHISAAKMMSRPAACTMASRACRDERAVSKQQVASCE